MHSYRWHRHLPLSPFSSFSAVSISLFLVTLRTFFEYSSSWRESSSCCGSLSLPSGLTNLGRSLKLFQVRNEFVNTPSKPILIDPWCITSWTARENVHSNCHKPRSNGFLTNVEYPQSKFKRENSVRAPVTSAVPPVTSAVPISNHVRSHQRLEMFMISLNHFVGSRAQ